MRLFHQAFGGAALGQSAFDLCILHIAQAAAHARALPRDRASVMRKTAVRMTPFARRGPPACGLAAIAATLPGRSSHPQKLGHSQGIYRKKHRERFVTNPPQNCAVDQTNMPSPNIRRAPNLSSRMPTGYCPTAYANENAERSRPIWDADKPSSALTEWFAIDSVPRSR